MIMMILSKKNLYAKKYNGFDKIIHSLVPRRNEG
jgi:hypothetical protein